MGTETWLPGVAPGGDPLAALLGLRPELDEAYRAFRQVIVRESGLDRELVARCAARVEWLLTACGDEPRPMDAAERARFAYVDKFVRDPHGVTDDDVVALRGALSIAQVVGLTEMLALLDGFTRLRLIFGTGQA